MHRLSGPKIFLILLFCCIKIFTCSKVYAQLLRGEMGARSQGLGNANSTLQDEWSIFNNVGGIAGIENGTIFFGYDRFFDIEGFDRVATGWIHPIRYGNIGVSVQRFGDDLYSEQILGGAYGNRIGFVSLGIKVNYFQMRIEDFGTANSVFLDFGGTVEMIQDLTFGAFIGNFTASVLNNAERTPLPVSMKLGISYTPTSDILFNLDLYKELEFDPSIRAGLEYNVSGNFYIRTGFNSNPIKFFFGAGIELKRFCIDYAVATHQFLGVSHQASVSFRYQN